MRSNKQTILRITGIGLFSAIVIVLQLLGSFIHLGVFSISLVLLPIVVGSALYGVGAGGILGFVFGVAVLLSGDANLFMGISVSGTVITVLAKGIAAGFASGFVYRALAKKNTVAATIVAAIVCPIVNTGVFLLGCLLFFMDYVRTSAAAEGFSNVGLYMIVGFVGLNFVAEFVINLLLSPTVMQIVKIGKKKFAEK